MSKPNRPPNNPALPEGQHDRHDHEIETREGLARIEHKLDHILSHQQQELEQMGQLDDSITALTTQVQQNTDVTSSAATLISGFSQRLADAIAAATAAGATPAQLQAVTDLQTAIAASDTALASAVAANTPAANPNNPPASAFRSRS